MSRCTRENILAQACLNKEAWELAIQIVRLFEEGALKGQKLSQKNLTSTPVFKQQNLQPIQSLGAEFQV